MRIVIIFCGSVLLSACAFYQSVPYLEDRGGYYKVGTPYEINGKTYTPHEDSDYVERGMASWYGPGFHGKKTANGERYNMNAYSAAHRTLPMPVYVRVRNLENGRSLVVRVNDRGPFAKDRIIDLSRRAAKKLGFLKKGTAHVEVRYLRRARLRERHPSYSSHVQSSYDYEESGKGQVGKNLRAFKKKTGGTSSSYYLQIGAFHKRHNAENLRKRLAEMGGLHIMKIQSTRSSRLLYIVRLGPYQKVADALQAKLFLGKQALDSIITDKKGKAL